MKRPKCHCGRTVYTQTPSNLCWTHWQEFCREKSTKKIVKQLKSKEIIPDAG